MYPANSTTADDFKREFFYHGDTEVTGSPIQCKEFQRSGIGNGVFTRRVPRAPRGKYILP